MNYILKVKKTIKFFSLLYFILLGVIFNIVIRNKKDINKDLIIKTDHLGDLIIWNELLESSSVSLTRNLPGINSTYTIDIYKLYYNPLYLYKITRLINANYNKVIVPSSSKTPEMFFLKLICKSKYESITIKDNNGNVNFMNIFERILFDKILIDTNNEYENVEIVKEYIHNTRNLNWLNDIKELNSDLVVLMPFASSQYKEINFNQYLQIIRKLNQKEINTVVIGKVNDLVRINYEKPIQELYYVSSLINKIKLDEYREYFNEKNIIYLGMDTSMFHFFYKNNLANKYFIIMGLGYGFKFIPKSENINLIYNNCNYNNCYWLCKFSTTKCIHDISF